MNRSPEFPSSPEGPTAASEIERHDLLAELARSRHESASLSASAEIARSPELHTLLSHLIEGGAELAPAARAHLRRMIAISYSFNAYLAELHSAEIDQELHQLAAASVQAELAELDTLAGADLTHEWDQAYQDLRQFYGDPVTDAINGVTDTMGYPEGE